MDSVEADGGGDRPEDVIGALEKVLGFAWSSQTRLLIHIADGLGIRLAGTNDAQIKS